MLQLFRTLYNTQKKKWELNFYRREIIKIYGGGAGNYVSDCDEEHREIVNFLRHNPARVLNYSFVDEMEKSYVQVFRDDEGMMYLLHNGEKMYFPRNWTEQMIREYYLTIMEEQYKDSPHCYLTQELLAQKYDTIVDIGGAEGVFALDMIEHTKKIYIFEAETYWKEPLEKTFMPWRNKVIVIPKYVSNKHNNIYTTLDYELSGEKIDLIKMDVEGAEIDVLKGAIGVCEANKSMRLLICVYHYAQQYEEIKQYLSGYEIKERHGYLLYHWGKERLEYPYLRRGVIEARKFGD